MLAAVIWLILAIVLIVAEVASGEFVLLTLGGAALIAAAAAALGLPIWATVLVFAASAGALVLAVRPALKRRLNRGIDQGAMHSNALVGRSATVVARVDGTGGRVKIGREIWSARSYNGEEVLEEGASVTVLDISGATAMVTGQD